MTCESWVPASTKDFTCFSIHKGSTIVGLMASLDVELLINLCSDNSCQIIAMCGSKKRATKRTRTFRLGFTWTNAHRFLSELHPDEVHGVLWISFSIVLRTKSLSPKISRFHHHLKAKRTDQSRKWNFTRPSNTSVGNVFLNLFPAPIAPRLRITIDP